MKYLKLFWTFGCWLSLFFVTIYHVIICNYETSFPVWFSTFVVWFAGFVALSSLIENKEFEV